MKDKDLIKIAIAAIEKSISYEDLYYSDYMYGNEKLTEKVWVFVEEAQEIGMVSFKEKYQL